MKICIKISGDFIQQDDLEKIIEWDCPFLPRVDEDIFLDEFIKDLPKEYSDIWRVWSVDWQYTEKYGIYPKIWVKHCDE